MDGDRYRLGIEVDAGIFDRLDSGRDIDGR
jgi:hypothetical protein